MGRAVRRRTAGLARGVLRDGDDGARPHDRPARRGHRSDLPAPRVRGRPEREHHRTAVRAPLGSLRDGELRGREDVEVARQPRVRERPAEARRRARDPARARCATTTAPGSSGTTPTSTKAPRCSTVCLPPRSAPMAPTPARSPPACAQPSTTTSTRPRRSRRSTTSRARSSPVATTRRRRASCCELGALLGVNLDHTAPESAEAARLLGTSADHGADEITITLPDGTAQRSPSRCHGGRGRERDRRRPRQSGAGGPSRRRVVRPRPSHRSRRDRRHRHASDARGSRGAAPLHRARDGAGRRRSVPRAPSTRSARRSTMASTTTSSFLAAPTSPTTTSNASRLACARS